MFLLYFLYSLLTIPVSLLLYYILYNIYLYIGYKPKKLQDIRTGFNKSFDLVDHRGYDTLNEVAENTYLVFKKGQEVSCTFYEIDIRVSKDRVPMLFHGTKLESTTSGYGKLEKKLYTELCMLNVSHYKT